VRVHSGLTAFAYSLPEEPSAGRDWPSQIKKQLSEEDVVIGVRAAGWLTSWKYGAA
jgi:hypothetical protein